MTLGCWVCDNVPDDTTERNHEIQNEDEDKVFDPTQSQEIDDEDNDNDEANLQDHVPIMKSYDMNSGQQLMLRWKEFWTGITL